MTEDSPKRGNTKSGAQKEHAGRYVAMIRTLNRLLKTYTRQSDKLPAVVEGEAYLLTHLTHLLYSKVCDL